MHISRRLFFNSIYSGLILAIAATFHYTADDEVVGAFLFAGGVAAILVMGSPLFTGAVGDTVAMHRKGWLPFLAVMLAGNIAGCLLCALGIQALHDGPTFVEAARETWKMKTEQGIGSCFVSSIFCGVLLYTSWRVNLKAKVRPILSGLVVLICVMVLVLCKFDHCIADSFYLFLSGTYSWMGVLTLLIAIVGNAVGSAFPAWLFRTRREEKRGPGNRPAGAVQAGGNHS